MHLVWRSILIKIKATSEDEESICKQSSGWLDDFAKLKTVKSLKHVRFVLNSNLLPICVILECKQLTFRFEFLPDLVVSRLGLMVWEWSFRNESQRVPDRQIHNSF